MDEFWPFGWPSVPNIRKFSTSENVYGLSWVVLELFAKDCLFWAEMCQNGVFWRQLENQSCTNHKLCIFENSIKFPIDWYPAWLRQLQNCFYLGRQLSTRKINEFFWNWNFLNIGLGQGHWGIFGDHFGVPFLRYREPKVSRKSLVFSCFSSYFTEKKLG